MNMIVSSQIKVAGALTSKILVQEPAGGTVALPLVEPLADGEMGCPLVVPWIV